MYYLLKTYRLHTSPVPSKALILDSFKRFEFIRIKTNEGFSTYWVFMLSFRFDRISSRSDWKKIKANWSKGIISTRSGDSQLYNFEITDSLYPNKYSTKNVRVCIVLNFDVSVLSISCLFNNNRLSVPFKMAYHFFVIFVLLSSISRVVLFIKTTSQGRIFIFRLKRYVFYLCSLLYHHHFKDTLNSLTLIINCCCSCNLDGL